MSMVAASGVDQVSRCLAVIVPPTNFFANDGMPSVAWVLANKAITAPIIGASRPEQLDASLAAATYALAPDLKEHLDDLTYEYRLGDAPR